MKPEEFKNIWTLDDDNLNPISGEKLKGLGLSESSIEFLVKSGLPDSAAPFLSFSKDSNDVYDSVQKLTTIYDFLEPEFEKYIVIGTCNDGDPIVINTGNNDRIEYLDHEDYFSSQPFNSDLSAMAKCLIAYRDFIKRVQAENGEDAFLNSDFTDGQFEVLKLDLKNADSEVIESDGFWFQQLEMELELREDANKGK
ncbi:SUKH-4 family immunity protein [Flavobacteriaceae bacterium GSB9]|nr:SUKH-4 family immunity protein [Flavobacteriaceae bacterium GSB9]UKM66621.1 SUKH-4 family immunity protein [Flavobacteriaceae bacterium GSB9]